MPATSRTSIFPTQIHSDGNGIQLRIANAVAATAATNAWRNK